MRSIRGKVPAWTSVRLRHAGVAGLYKADAHECASTLILWRVSPAAEARTGASAAKLFLPGQAPASNLALQC